METAESVALERGSVHKINSYGRKIIPIVE